ncbi:polypeptide N-acetylgalactosaminyltransferase 5-like [Babylonia areolata]|uniref:polypeptide N-acetylgalactosaminyltransferase 5-like n=1 Tax=Babylonia areolata TaxID=304850 RepID=UPI003FCF4A6B
MSKLYRLLFKKRTFCCFWLCYVLCSCAVFFISDDSFDHQDHDVYHIAQGRPRMETPRPLKASLPSVHDDSKKTAANAFAKRRPIPLVFGRLSASSNDTQREAAAQRDTDKRPRSENETRRAADAELHGNKPGIVVPGGHEGHKVAGEGEKRLGGPEELSVQGGVGNVGNASKDLEKDWVPPPNPGEGGQAVNVKEGDLSRAQLETFRRGRKTHHFNQFVSDLISLHRSVPHILERQECQRLQYRPDLPSTSVVIIFHNEAWSTLLRTVHSVLDRSPPHVLHRIILVDDLSDLEHLKKPLEDYISQPELSKVTLVRSPTREGLIKARLLGLHHANTSVVVFLDSHCECFEGWLEPLLEPIARDPSTVTVPVIDAINHETFGISLLKARDISVGTFTWSLLFNWMPIQPHERLRRQSDTDPIRSPTMAGGLFAIDRAFFYKLGTYDPGMKIWGGENMELSFKIWMCGGSLVTLPCSHVGHVFRLSAPHSSGGFRNYLAINLGRLAAVWLDDYSVYSYTARRVTQEEQLKLIGDISERQELRRGLKCHSFGWFMKHVMPEAFLPADQFAHGQIKNEHTGTCIRSNDKVVVLSRCQKTRISNNMKWYMNQEEHPTIFQDDYQLRSQQSCLDNHGKSRTLDRLRCHGMGGNQEWKYFKDRKQLYHVASERCAEASPAEKPPTVVMAACDPNNPLQQWLWDTSPTQGPSWRKDEAAGRPVL